MYDARLLLIYLHKSCLRNLNPQNPQLTFRVGVLKETQPEGDLDVSGDLTCVRGGTDIGSPSIVSTGHRERTVQYLMTVHPPWHTQLDSDAQSCAHFEPH